MLAHLKHDSLLSQFNKQRITITIVLDLYDVL
jgi:hypothetical protein